MFTSDKAKTGAGRLSVPGAYLLAAAACAAFGAVYELFSHGVVSYFMIGAFVFPLLLGAVPCLLLRRSGKALPGGIAAVFVRAGVAALTVGSVVQGILEIYGTTNPLLLVYWIAGGVMTAAGWLASLLPGKR